MGYQGINHGVDVRYKISSLFRKDLPVLSEYAHKVDAILRFPKVSVSPESNLDENKFSFSVHRDRRYNYLSAVKKRNGDFVFADQPGHEIDDSDKYMNIPKLNPRFLNKKSKGEKPNYRADPNIYADGEYNFVLWYDTDPLCFVSFDIIENEAVIYSLQGIGKLDNGKLRHFDWSETLVKGVEDYARMRGLSGVSIIRGKDNLWYRNFSPRAESIYDETATRMGYSEVKKVPLKAKKLSERQSREVLVLSKGI